MIYSYMRVSIQGGDQTTVNQKLKIDEYAQRMGFSIDEEIALEISSRKTLEARRITELIDRLKDGDVLISYSLSRIARNTVEIIQTIDSLLNKGVQVILIAENLNLKKHDPVSKLMVSIFGSFAELERSLISERTKAGLERARAEGKRIGRKNYGSKFDAYTERITTLIVQGYSIRSIALEHLTELKLKSCTSLRNWLDKQNLTAGKTDIIQA